MHSHRTSMPAALAAATTFAASASPAQNGKWPDQPIRFIVPYGSGGGTAMATCHMGQSDPAGWHQASLISQ